MPARRQKRRPVRKQTVAKVVERELLKRQEVKRLDHFIDGATLQDEARTPLVAELTAVAQGDDRNQRDGLQVYAKTLQFKYMISNADTSNWTRVLVFRWHATTTPTIDDLIENTASAEMSLVSPYQAEPDTRYEILYDKMHKTVAASSNLQVLAKKTLKLNYKIRYSGGAAGDGYEGIYLIAYSDSTAVTDPPMYLATRFRYTDM